MVPSSPTATLAAMAIATPLRKALTSVLKPTGTFSLRDIAAESEIGLTTLADFVHERGSLRIDQVERLAGALGYTVNLTRKAKR